MRNFNVGAWRPAKGDARAARLAAASNLVQRTLARHGLMPQDHAESGPASATFPELHSALAGPGTSPDATSAKIAPPHPRVALRQGRYSCGAGSRTYRTFVPSTASAGVSGLVVMLHGCTQTPEDFANGTGMNVLAEKNGFVVIYPQQSRGDNAQSCWNWFSPGDQRRDQGEPAILAGITREAMAEFGASPDRTFVAGLSAGAAMAVILGETYPDVFAGVGVHSGLPFGAAKDVPSAFAAMSGAPPEAPHPALAGKAVRTIVIHGSADAVVHPSNGGRIVRDALHRVAGQTLETEEKNTASGRRFTRRIISGPHGATEVEHWTIEGLAHAWSGGHPTGSHTDASGPDASAEMIRFFFEDDDKGI